MDIGDKNFKTKKSAIEYTQKIINKIGLCPSIRTKSIDDYNFFIDLFRLHPDYPEKIDNICDISIVKNKVNTNLFQLNILKNDGSIDNISWVACVTGKKKDSFKSALRVSIEPQIKDFRTKCIYECSICKTKVSPIDSHVDHENHFEEILCKFLKTTNKKKPTEFKDTDDGRKSFTLNDKEYEDEWKLFHENNACLRLLCKSCNLKRPKWKNVNI